MATMVPTTVLADSLMAAMAGDTASIAPAALACHVHLIIEDFTPGPGTDFTALDEATYTGGADKSAGVGAQQDGQDPATGQRLVRLLEPAGGWTWTCTVAPATPETVFGWVVTDNADAVTLGSGKLDVAVTVSAVGDMVTIDHIDLPFPAGLITP